MDQGMQYVYEVYLEKSFSRAAEKLFVSQPALSIAVRKVEEALGSKLFDRSSQPLRLTPAGEVYIRQVQRLRMLEEEMLSQINDLSALRRGHLRIGGTHYFNAYVLPQVLAAFSSQYPGIELSLREASSARILRELVEGHIDVMISAVPFDERQFDQRSVFEDHILLVVPDGLPGVPPPDGRALSRDMVLADAHLKRDCPRLSLEPFSQLPFLMLTAGNNLHQRSLSMCREAGFEPRVRLMVEQFTTSYALSCSGLGLSFASTLLIAQDPPAPVHYYKLDSTLADRSFRAIMRKDAYRSHAVEAFLDMIVACYPQACPL